MQHFSSSFLADIIGRSGDAILIMDAPEPGGTPRIVYANTEFERASGYSCAAVAGKPIDILYRGHANDSVLVDLRAKLHAGGTAHADLMFFRADGSPYWVEVTNFSIVDPSNGRCYWVSLQRDVTSKKADEQRIRTLTAALENADDAILVARVDLPYSQPAIIEYANAAFFSATGYGEDAVIGRSAAFLYGPHTDPESLSLIRDDMIERGGARSDLEIYRSDGSTLWMECNVRRLFGDEQHIYFVSVLRDVTERKAREQRLLEESREISYAAYHDPLTGLNNRRAFEEFITELITKCASEDDRHMLALLDLDGFKQINDIAGHPAGDVALREVANRIRSRVRQKDMVARIGGDEFAIVLPDCHRRPGLLLFETVRKHIAEAPFILGPARFSLSVSIGVAELSSETKGVSAAISEADTASYVAKRAGGNRIATDERV